VFSHRNANVKIYFFFLFYKIEKIEYYGTPPILIETLHIRKEVLKIPLVGMT